MRAVVMWLIVLAICVSPVSLVAPSANQMQEMNEIIDRSVKMCFSSEKMQRIVRRILEKVENNGRMKSLELLSLKVIMTQRMIRDDSDKEEVMLKLLFREPQNLLDFLGLPYFPNARYKSSEVKTDPHIMLLVLNQTMPGRCLLDITITEDALELSINGCLTARFSNEEGNIEFETFWVHRFARMALFKRLHGVFFRFRGKEEYNEDYARTYVDGIISTLPHSTRPKSRDPTIDFENRRIYERSRPYALSLGEPRIFQTAFTLVTSFRFHTSSELLYDFSELQ